MDQNIVWATPDPEAVDLAEQMREERDVMEAILQETVESARNGALKESGRTVCGGDKVKAPGARYNKAVQLQACPVGSTGTWHSHATQSELRNPEHSLPDWANVIFHDIDASIVVGTQTLEQVVAAEDRRVMADEFQEALGLDVSRTDQVVGALQQGQIPDPPAARERVRDRLSPLVSRHRTDFFDLDDSVQGPAVPAYAPGFDVLVAREVAAANAPDVGNLRKSARNGSAILGKLDRRLGGVKGEAVSSAVGIVVGSVVSKMLGL